MLNEEYATTIFDGVELSKMTIDQLRTQESKLTSKVIECLERSEYWELIANVDSSEDVANYVKAQDERRNAEQSLDIIKSEITARYAEMQVFV